MAVHVLIRNRDIRITQPGIQKDSAGDCIDLNRSKHLRLLFIAAGFIETTHGVQNVQHLCDIFVSIHMPDKTDHPDTGTGIQRIQDALRIYRIACTLLICASKSAVVFTAAAPRPTIGAVTFMVRSFPTPAILSPVSLNFLPVSSIFSSLA